MSLQRTLRLAPSTLRTHRPIASIQTSFPTASTANVTKNTRNFSITRMVRGGDSHGSHYDPPTGWLWGVPPGQKVEKEGWEGVWYWGFYGGLGLCVVAYAFKPDTNIETWALEEAKRRLQAEGTLPEDK